MSITRLSDGLTPADGADPRTFPTIFNAAADLIEQNESDVAEKVAKAGDTMTGGLTAPNVTLGVTAAGSDTVALDFLAGDGFVSRAVGGTAVTVTGTNYSEGATQTVRFIGGTAVASLDVPVDWTFVGSAVGTAIGTAVTAVLTATSFGTAASDVVAAWAEEA